MVFLIIVSIPDRLGPVGVYDVFKYERGHVTSVVFTNNSCAV